MALVPFCGIGNYRYKGRSTSSQRAINMIPENIEIESSMAKRTFVNVDGSVSAVNFSSESGGIRGTYASTTGPGPTYDSLLYVGVGNAVYRVNENLNTVKLGDVGANSTTIKMIDNGFDLCIVDGFTLFTCPLSADDLDLELTQVELPIRAGTETYITPDQITFLNQRIIVNDTNGNQFYWSDLANAKSWNNLSFSTAESNADKITSLITRGGELWVFGPKSYEIYSGTNNSFAPFARVGGSSSEIGCNAPNSVCQIGDLIFFLGSSRAGRNTVYMANSFTPTRISNNALETELENLIATTDAIGGAYAKEGHIFYILTFPQADKTYVYDVSTNLWHERATRDNLINVQHLWNPVYPTLAYNKIYFGSYDSPNLIYLSEKKYTEWDGRQIVKEVIGPTYIDDYNPIIVRQFYLDIETGTTPLLQGNGSDPQIMLQISKDGGYTFGSEHWTSLGKTGKYTTRAKWNNLGQGREFVFRVVISDPIPVIMTNARMIFEKSQRRY